MDGLRYGCQVFDLWAPIFDHIGFEILMLKHISRYFFIKKGEKSYAGDS